MKLGRAIGVASASSFAIWAVFALVCPLAVAESLMKRADHNPVISVRDAPSWRSVHVANAAVLTPQESLDGKWRMFIRGSGFFPDEGGKPEDHYHDTIGLLYQDSESFSPVGLWKEHPGNPILVHGPRDAYDGRHLLDCAPVWGRGERGEDLLVMFYKGVSYRNGGSLAGACSTDRGASFEKFKTNPLLRHAGPCDAVFHNDRYYVFFGDAKYDPRKRRNADKLKIYLAITAQPADLANVPRQLVLDTGVQGTFDSFSVHGGRIFRLGGRWYMVYQCSDRHLDYPNRFHVAWSTNLTEWNKIVSSQPFFERGPAGAWDEGAIWYGEVIEHEKILYMYYEGWGTGRPGYNRDKPYVPGGHSQTGLASVSVEQFLKWCGHF